MPAFVEDPARLSKSRLKSDLVAHNVKLPPAKSKKEVYVEMHLRHIGQKKADDFSSDEDEDQVEDEARGNPEDAEIHDPSALTDDDLKAALLKHGFEAGPIVASTRALYEKKLSRLLQCDGHGNRHDQINGAEKGMLYSDSDDGEENEEDDDAESGGEEEKQETIEQADHVQRGSSQVKLQVQNSGVTYPQCFMPPRRLHARASRESSPTWNSGNALKSSESSRPPCSRIPVGISRATCVDQHSGLGSGMESRSSLSTCANGERESGGSNVQEHWSQSNRLEMPVKDNSTWNDKSLYHTPTAPPSQQGIKGSVKNNLKDLYPAVTTPTGIYATCRRPIKGAAGRPVQYLYPDTPVSPTTAERKEIKRRLVPIHIQILFFVIMSCFLYVIYVCFEDSIQSVYGITAGFEPRGGDLVSD